jgi:hypothetical protein
VGRFCVHITTALIADSGVDPTAVKARWRPRRSGRACCQSTDGTPLMNGVLYGVDTRAAKEIDDLNAEIGEATRFLRFRQCADLAIGWSQDPLVQAQPSRALGEDAQDSQRRPAI